MCAHELRLFRLRAVEMLLGFFLRAWLASDACLDEGGSFDYKQWECSDETQPFADVSVYSLRSFWAFVGTLTIAIGLQRYRGRAGDQRT
jgi:hypothetical protein